MDALDAELIEDACQVAGVTVNGVDEPVGFVGAVVASMSGAIARANVPAREMRRRQSSAGPGLPCRKTTASAASLGPACRYGLRMSSTAMRFAATCASRPA
jgi:hypothetical protein